MFHVTHVVLVSTPRTGDTTCPTPPSVYDLLFTVFTTFNVLLLSHITRHILPSSPSTTSSSSKELLQCVDSRLNPCPSPTQVPCFFTKFIPVLLSLELNRTKVYG